MSKIDKIEKLIAEIAEELEKYGGENDLENYENVLTEAQAKLGAVMDAVDDFKDAFQDLKNFDDSEYEDYYFNDDYNGVGQADFLETFYI